MPGGGAAAGSAGQPRPRAETSQQLRAQQYRADQGRVWDEVERTVHALAAHAPTRAMADSYEAGKDDLERLVKAFSPDALFPAADAVGAVVFWGGDLVCLDLLQPPKRFGQLYPKLLLGYAFEALMHAKLGGRRKAWPKEFDPEVHEQSGVDLGQDLRLETERVFGAGLAWQQELIQLSVFPRKGD